MDAQQNATNKNSGSFTNNQANSFFVSSAASTGANSKSGGKTPTTQFMSVPSDESTHGSGLLIKEQAVDQLP